MTWTRDGHMLQIALGADWSWQIEVKCPGPERCLAKWEPGAMPPGVTPCWLQYMVDQFGTEWLEWWCASQGGHTKPVMLDGPLEFEWTVEGGGDEPETFWRPLGPPLDKPSEVIDWLIAMEGPDGAEDRRRVSLEAIITRANRTRMYAPPNDEEVK